MNSDDFDRAALYRDTMQRIASLVGAAADEVPVPACPGWSVRDVLAHLAGVAQDWAAGSLAAPPTDAETAAQVARFDGLAVADIIRLWGKSTDEMLLAGIVPPLCDVVVHEHDIRQAVGRPGERDSVAVQCISDQLLSMLTTPVPLRVIVAGAEYRCGPEVGGEIGLRTTAFESIRWRTGRRSRRQMAAMDWSGDPAPVLEHLYLFGPSTADLRE